MKFQNHCIYVIYLILWLSFAGCSHHYSISGSVNEKTMQEGTLYLSVMSEYEQPQYIDSCSLEHGFFTFAGRVDSVMMGHLALNGRVLMPIVIERGEMDVSLDVLGMGVYGGLLNVRLNELFNELNKIQQEWSALNDKRLFLMANRLGGHKEFERILAIEDSLNLRAEKLQSDFIIENFDNVLGPGLFMMICNKYPAPIMTPQLRGILNQAPNFFLEHPGVSTFIQRVNYNIE